MLAYPAVRDARAIVFYGRVARGDLVEERATRPFQTRFAAVALWAI